MNPLTIQAGERAYARIQRDGLRADDIAAVFGASGAAKWLGIYGLDSAIFSHWLRPATQRILLYGTSVGAFKLAAAAQADPAAAFKRLADTYIEQNYSDGLSPEAIASETARIVDSILPEQAVSDVLTSHKYIFSCAAVKCFGPLASDSPGQQRLGMVHAALRSIMPRGIAARLGVAKDPFERVIFAHPDASTWLQPMAGQLFALCEKTFKPAILASGSLPVYMRGITGLGSAGDDVYRDGGLLDYHPVPANVLARSDGLVLYPHFFPHLVERWFDKFYPWRKVPGSRLSDVVLVSPSPDFTRSLPQGRIPDRKDFLRFQNRDDERMALWRQAAERSHELGESFLELVRSGDVARVVTRIPG